MPIPIPSRQLFIDGQWREPIHKNRLPVVNPATEQIIGDIPAATAEDVELAVAAARRAFSQNQGRDWAGLSGTARGKYLRAIASKIIEKKETLAKLEAIDNGKPLDEAAWDIDDVASCFEYYADLAEALDKKQKAPIELPMDTFKCHILKEPLGVVRLITPWNYPMLMAAWKVAPALAAGCTAILKPSELASVTCLELADVCIEVGLPPGVLNIITGLGSDAGAPLAAHPHVDKQPSRSSQFPWSLVGKVQLLFLTTLILIRLLSGLLLVAFGPMGRSAVQHPAFLYMRKLQQSF